MNNTNLEAIKKSLKQNTNFKFFTQEEMANLQKSEKKDKLLGKRTSFPDSLPNSNQMNQGFIFNKLNPVLQRTPHPDPAVDFLRVANAQNYSKFESNQFELRNSTEKSWFQHITEPINFSFQKFRDTQLNSNPLNPEGIKSFERDRFPNNSQGGLTQDARDIRDSSNRLMQSFANSCDYNDQDSSIKFAQDSIIRQLKLNPDSVNYYQPSALGKSEYLKAGNFYNPVKVEEVESQLKIEFEEPTTAVNAKEAKESLQSSFIGDKTTIQRPKPENPPVAVKRQITDFNF
jgi:hypothetical protein